MGTAIIQAIQTISCPELDIFFQVITMMGEPVVMILLLTTIYWCGDKRRGEQLAFAMLVSLTLNGVIKDTVRAPRPVGEPGVRSLRVETATGHSFPSGHSQAGATLYLSLALWLKRRVYTAGAVLLTLLIGLSRLYLGVHYPRDVVAGIAFGAITAVGIHLLFLKTRNHTAIYIASAVILIPMTLALGESADSFMAVGALAGFLAGVAFEKKFVNFSPLAPLGTKLARWVLGVLLLGAAYALLKALLPGGVLFVALRYAIVVFFGIGIVPMLFSRLGAGRVR